MKVLIIEDEERSFSRLKRLLNNIDNQLEIQGPLASIDAVIAHLQNHEIDIIFSDIRLGDGEVFEAFLQVPPKVPVVFITAYNEYALEAFKSNGIAYLQKPIAQEDFEKAFQKAKLICGKNFEISDLVEKLGNITGKKWREHFLVHTFDGYKLVKTADIKYFFSENGVVRAFLEKGNSVTLNDSLSDLENQLCPDKFFRANRQYIINIDSVDKLQNFFNYKMMVKLHDFPNVRIIISKDKIPLIKNWLNH